MKQEKANEEVFQMLLDNQIVTFGIAPKLVVIPDAVPLQQRLHDFLPIFLLVQIFSFLIGGSKDLWQIVLGKYSTKPVVKVFKVVAFVLGQIEAFTHRLVARFQARKAPKARLQVVRWLIQPGDLFTTDTPILEFRYSSLIPYRYMDVHQYFPSQGGVLVQAITKPNRTARGKVFTFIPLEAYTLLAEAQTIKQTLMLPPKTVKLAIAEYKAEIQNIEQDNTLSESDRRILKASLLSQVNKLFS